MKGGMGRRRFLRLAGLAAGGVLTAREEAWGALLPGAGRSPDAPLGGAGALGRAGPLGDSGPWGGDGPAGGGGSQTLASDTVRPLGPEGVAARPGEIHLVVLHTNDTHSRIDPFPRDGGPYAGLGGVDRRATLIDRVREAHPHVLLLDSGDIFQGTPYFNFFHGEVEFRAMTRMAYDAATLGNHDFDNGVQGLVEMMPLAGFPFVSANYEVAGSALEGRVQRWVVRELGGARIGIFGLGIAFEGLVLDRLHTGVRYRDPIEAAREAVAELRAQGCSLVICLSHLGYRYRGSAPSDTRLAQEVEGIDLILGGHTHTFMDEPDVYTHPDGRLTLVNQVGWGGMRLGRIDVVLGEPSAGPRAAPRKPSPARPLRWATGGYRIDALLDS